MSRRFQWIGFWFSKEWLLSKFMLVSLFWINALGTVYGYIWYGQQLEYTLSHRPAWMALLVPDSPTASLFFTLSLLYLMWDARKKDSANDGGLIRSLVDTLGAVTSIKYGIWAVSMIAAGAAQGDPTNWQDWMLSISHLGMAAEAILYVRFLKIRSLSLAVVAVWTLFNDYSDYNYTIYPWLPSELDPYLGEIEAFTVGLSALSLLIIYWLGRRTSFQSPKRV